MKKLAIYLSIIIALFVVLYILNVQSQKASENAINEEHATLKDEAQQLYDTTPAKLDPATVEQLDDKNYQNIILPNELESKLDNEGSLIVYFFSPTCPHCQRTTPDLMAEAEKMNVDIVQFNLLEFDQGWSDYDIKYTPTLVYFKDGKEADRLVGGIMEDASQGNTLESYKQFLKKHS